MRLMLSSIMLVACVHAAFAAAPRARAADDAALANAIALSLDKDDPAQWQDAQTQLQRLTARNPRLAYMSLTSKWLKPMLKHKLYDEVESLALEGLLSNPASATGRANMQECRVRGFLAAGKYPQALAAAKGYYNVCLLSDTAEAIELLAEALGYARGQEDPGIVVRFKLQQAQGAKIPKEISSPMALPSELGENVLKSIKVDAQPYAQRLDAALAAPDSFGARNGAGNLLLLSDRPTEAKLQFERAAKLATDERQLSTAIENIARAIRAQDALIGRANAFVMQLRQHATAPPAQSEQENIVGTPELAE
jgi:hypothetical protein